MRAGRWQMGKQIPGCAQPSCLPTCCSWLLAGSPPKAALCLQRRQRAVAGSKHDRLLPPGWRPHLAAWLQPAALTTPALPAAAYSLPAAAVLPGKAPKLAAAQSLEGMGRTDWQGPAVAAATGAMAAGALPAAATHQSRAGGRLDCLHAGCRPCRPRSCCPPPWQGNHPSAEQPALQRRWLLRPQVHEPGSAPAPPPLSRRAGQQCAGAQPMKPPSS